MTVITSYDDTVICTVSYKSYKSSALKQHCLWMSSAPLSCLNKYDVNYRSKVSSCSKTPHMYCFIPNVSQQPHWLLLMLVKVDMRSCPVKVSNSKTIPKTSNKWIYAVWSRRAALIRWLTWVTCYYQLIPYSEWLCSHYRAEHHVSIWLLS